MAGIDKIYGTPAQYYQLRGWVMRNKPEYLRHFLEDPPEDATAIAIANTPQEMDKYLWDNCPFPWVRERLSFMYNGTP